MFKEALTQSTSGGVPFVDCLKSQGILPGIKVDEVFPPRPPAPVCKPHGPVGF